jgi:hypothetical protein
MSQGMAMVTSWNGGGGPSNPVSYCVVGNSSPGTGQQGSTAAVTIVDGMSISEIQKAYADAIQADWLAGTGGVPLAQVLFLDFKSIDL